MRGLGRDVHTVLKWVHDFNVGGPAAPVSRLTGGTPAHREMPAPLVREVLNEAPTVAARPFQKNAEAPADSASQADKEATVPPALQRCAGRCGLWASWPVVSSASGFAARRCGASFTSSV